MEEEQGRALAVFGDREAWWRGELRQHVAGEGAEVLWWHAAAGAGGV